MINEEIVQKNKELVKKYPFLAPKMYDWDYYDKTGKDRYIIPDDYDYTWTWLDDMPKGWRKSFGEEMCRSLKTELVKHHYLNEYVVVDVKEKYGALRWTDGGIPIGAESIWDITHKYEDISKVTCIYCGKPATKISKGWICPWCDDCAKEIDGEFEDIVFNNEEMKKYMTPPEE